MPEEGFITEQFINKLLQLSVTAKSSRSYYASRKTLGYKERVQALYLLKMEQVTELKELARIVGRDPSTLYRWFKRYKVGGLASLLELGYAKGGHRRNSCSRCRPHYEGAATGFASYGAIQNWLQEEYGLGVLPMMCDEARQVVWRQSFT